MRKLGLLIRWWSVRWWLVGMVAIVLVAGFNVLTLAESLQILIMYTLVLITAQYATSTRKMVEEMEQQRIEVARPSLSLRPEHYIEGGGFISLLLQNTGGIAKDVNIDIETTSLSEKKSLFIPAIDKEHIVYLPIRVDKVSEANGVVKVKLHLKDNSNRELVEELSIDFGKLKEESRDFAFQESPILMTLDRIDRTLGQIESNFRSLGSR
ncbi:hypothetical protein ES705_32653 [subsurface metagenome]